MRIRNMNLNFKTNYEPHTATNKNYSIQQVHQMQQKLGNRLKQFTVLINYQLRPL